jgi:hypothetical protein
VHEKFVILLLVTSWFTPVMAEVLKDKKLPEPQSSVPEKSGIQKESGVVRMLGSAMNMTVTLSNRDGDVKNIPLCRNGLDKRIGRLGGMTVEAHGHWELEAQTSTGNCFAADTFIVTKTTTGGHPVVGMLSHKGDDYILTTDDGKIHKLNKISKGLISLAGKKVIVDLRPLSDPKEQMEYKVVTYSEYP